MGNPNSDPREDKRPTAHFLSLLDPILVFCKGHLMEAMETNQNSAKSVYPSCIHDYSESSSASDRMKTFLASSCHYIVQHGLDVSNNNSPLQIHHQIQICMSFNFTENH